MVTSLNLTIKTNAGDNLFKCSFIAETEWTKSVKPSQLQFPSTSSCRQFHHGGKLLSPFTRCYSKYKKLQLNKYSCGVSLLSSIWPHNNLALLMVIWVISWMPLKPLVSNLLQARGNYQKVQPELSLPVIFYANQPFLLRYTSSIWASVLILIQIFLLNLKKNCELE